MRVLSGYNGFGLHNQPDYKPLNDDGPHWERLRRRADVSGFRFHDLRHEAVSRLFEKGLKMPEVAANSRAAPRASTKQAERYGVLTPEDASRDHRGRRKAARLIGQAPEGPDGIRGL